MPQAWEVYGNRAPAAPEPAPQGKNLWEKVRDAGAGIGNWLDQQAAQELLSRSNPGLYRSFVRRMSAGEEIPASEIFGEVRKAIDPGWSKASAQDRMVAMGLTAAEPAAGWALGLLGGAAGGVVGKAPGAVIGGTAGRIAGPAIARTMANVANPEAAGRNILWDVAGLAGGKALGTLASRQYRSLLQPTLARRFPRAEKVLSQAESALDPLTGPAARNYGLPRSINRRLQRMGPQGVAPMGPRTPIVPGPKRLPPGRGPDAQGLPGGVPQQSLGPGTPQRMFPGPQQRLPGTPQRLLPGRVPPMGQQDLDLPGVAVQQSLGLPRMRPFRPPQVGRGPQPGQQLGLPLEQPTYQQALAGIGQVKVYPGKPSGLSPIHKRNIREVMEQLPPEADDVPTIEAFLSGSPEALSRQSDPVRTLRKLVREQILKQETPPLLESPVRFQGRTKVPPKPQPIQAEMASYDPYNDPMARLSKMFQTEAPPAVPKPKPKPKAQPKPKEKAPSKPVEITKPEATETKRAPWKLKTRRDKKNIARRGYIEASDPRQEDILGRSPRELWTPEEVLSVEMRMWPGSIRSDHIKKVTEKGYKTATGMFFPFKNRYGVIKAPALKAHFEKIQRALFYNKPVSSEAVEFYDIALPDGYVKEGTQYVFKGKKGK